MLVSQIKLISNYVLVKPDPHLETYQWKSKETNLIAPDFKYEKGTKINVKERNYSTMGTVYAVPDYLIFNGKPIDDIKKHNTLFIIVDEQIQPVNIAMHRQIRELTEASVDFDVPMELCTGDRVNFSYTAHKKSKEAKLVLDTDQGEMYLIKYDMIYMTLDENNQPKKMLNGYVIVEPEMVKTDMEDGREIVKHESGLITLAPKQRQKKRKKTLLGTVKLAGTHCEGYLQERDKYDYYKNAKTGDKIMYDTRAKINLEYESHQIISDKTLHLIQRKDIHFIYDQEQCLI